MVVGLVALVTSMLVASSASAAARVYRNVPITPVIRHTVTLGWGTHTISTQGTSTMGDPVMHVMDATGVQVGYSDDYLAYDPQVTINYPGTYQVIVYAYGPDSFGTTNLVVDGVPVLVGARFQGQKLVVDAGPYVIQAAAHPTAAGGPGGSVGVQFSGDPFIYGLLGTTWRSFDDDGGTGNLFKLDARTVNVNRILIGDYAPAVAWGSIDIFQNDADNDLDGDTLGLDLETLLGTCDRITQPGCGSAEYCAEIDNPLYDSMHAARLSQCFVDSDRDGIPDNVEVFGMEDPAYWNEPQHYPGMGADPRRKDIFVEVDHDPLFGGPPVSESDVMYAVVRFMDAPTSVAHQSAGAGYALHMDIGNTCYTHPESCGSWGGSNATPTSPPARSCTVAGIPSGLAENDASFRPIRRPYFRYAAIKYGADGGVADDVPGHCMNWGGTPGNRDMGTFTHELGHTLGLFHHGHLAWGVANCKPHYVSIMNYSGGWDSFSTGIRLETLNPAALVEAGAYTPFPGQGPGTYLQRFPPIWAAQHNFAFNALFESVDWNFDNTWTSPSVRATPLVSVNGFECPEVHKVKGFGLGAGDYVAPATGTRLVRVGTLLYAFWLTSTGALWYQWATLGSATAVGSCTAPGGGDMAFPNVSCLSWSSSFQLGPGGMSSFAVAPIDPDHLVLSWRESSGTIVAEELTSAAGPLTELLPTREALSFGGDPELSILFDGPPGTATRSVGLFYARYGGWWTRQRGLGSGDPWTPEAAVLLTSGAQVLASNTLRGSVIAWPNHDAAWASTGRNCAALPSPASTPYTFLYCRDRMTGRWEWSSSVGRSVVAPPTLAFHTLRNGDGAAIGTGQGQLWIANPEDGSAVYRMYRTDTVTLSYVPGSTLWINPMDLFTGGALSLYEDTLMGSMHAIADIPVSKTTRRPMHLPFFDGTYTAQLKDGNDFSVIETSICYGLKRYTSALPANDCGRRHTNTLVTNEMP